MKAFHIVRKGGEGLEMLTGVALAESWDEALSKTAQELGGEVKSIGAGFKFCVQRGSRESPEIFLVIEAKLFVQ